MIKIVLIALSSLVFAVPPKGKNKSDKQRTNMSFEELLVQGKYHFTDEAVTTVEDDKILDGLLQVRKDFKDRIKQSSARY